MAVEPQLWIDGHAASAADLRRMAMINYGALTSFSYQAGGVRGLDLHLQRLISSGQELFGQQLDKSRILKALCAALATVGEAWVRVTLTAPDLSMRTPEQAGDVVVGVWVSAPAQALADGQRLSAIPHQRELAHLKHLGTTGIIHARRKARMDGFDDALLISSTGQILEGTVWNIGLICDDTVVWPMGDILDGVTRRLIESGLSEMGISQAYEAVSLRDLSRFEAAFLCNAATPAGSISGIDGYGFDAEHPMLARIRDAWTRQALQPL